MTLQADAKRRLEEKDTKRKEKRLLPATFVRIGRKRESTNGPHSSKRKVAVKRSGTNGSSNSAKRGRNSRLSCRESLTGLDVREPS
jgi:hypothetical protein